MLRERASTLSTTQAEITNATFAFDITLVSDLHFSYTLNISA